MSIEHGNSKPVRTSEICPKCGGSGKVRTEEHKPDEIAIFDKTCTKCNGTGVVIINNK